MLMYGKTAANAIAVMSFLAAHPGRRAGSGEIAEARGISRALTAKILTRLATARLVEGQPGPGGGYRIARPAAEISLLNVVTLFEQSGAPMHCPFGENWCEQGDPCPLHEQMSGVFEENRRFVAETTFAAFSPVAAPVGDQ